MDYEYYFINLSRIDTLSFRVMIACLKCKAAYQSVTFSQPFGQLIGLKKKKARILDSTKRSTLPYGRTVVVVENSRFCDRTRAAVKKSAAYSGGCANDLKKVDLNICFKNVCYEGGLCSFLFEYD